MEAARYAGVQLRMEDGWKTYWRNPGDSGVPPTFDWSGSKNLKSVDVFYPVPHRFSDANGTAIGYDNEVVFPIRVTPKQADKPIQLSLTFDYGLCKDLCIPNSVDLTGGYSGRTRKRRCPANRTGQRACPPSRECDVATATWGVNG